MGNITNMTEAIGKLKSAAAAINDIADWLTATSDADIQTPEKPGHTLEEVRAVLAEKSGDGYTAQVRELIHKYGAEKLSGVDPLHYDALIREAEALGSDNS